MGKKLYKEKKELENFIDKKKKIFFDLEELKPIAENIYIYCCCWWRKIKQNFNELIKI